MKFIKTLAVACAMMFSAASSADLVGIDFNGMATQTPPGANNNLVRPGDNISGVFYIDPDGFPMNSRSRGGECFSMNDQNRYKKDHVITSSIDDKISYPKTSTSYVRITQSSDIVVPTTLVLTGSFSDELTNDSVFYAMKFNISRTQDCILKDVLFSSMEFVSLGLYRNGFDYSPDSRGAVVNLNSINILMNQCPECQSPIEDDLTDVSKLLLKSTALIKSVDTTILELEDKFNIIRNNTEVNVDIELGNIEQEILSLKEESVSFKNNVDSIENDVKIIQEKTRY